MKLFTSTLITAVGQKLNPFILQKLALAVLSAERKGFRKLPLAGDDPKAGDIVGAWVDVQGIPHNPCPARITRIRGNLSV